MPDASDDGGDHVATRITHGEGGDSVASVDSVNSVRSADSVDSVASIDSIGSIDSTGSSGSLDEGRQSVTPTTPASKSPAVKPARPLDAHRSLKPPQTPKMPVSPPFARSFDRPAPNLDLTRGLNLHALGISTSPLGPLERRISFASNSEAGSGRGELERFRDYGPGGGDDIDNFNVAYTNGSSDFGLVEESEPDHDLGLGLDQDYEFEYSYNDVTGDFDASIAEDDKDVLIDRLQDVVRHVSSYTPSSPSHSTRTRSVVSSAQTSPLRDKAATPAGKNVVAATTPASRSLMAVTSPAKSMYRTGAVADTPTPKRPAAPFNTPDENVMSALHAHIDEMEAVLAAAMAAEAVANAAAAASPRNRHNQHGRHYPWQRSSEQRLRPTSMSMSGFNLDGSSDRPDERISSSARSSPQKRRGPFLEAAPVLIRNQSAPPRVDMVTEAAKRDKTLAMPEVAELTEAESLLATPTTGKTDDLTKDSMVVDAQVIGDCEALADDLSTVLESLMRRSQEADAIQQALMAQLEAANQRNAELEEQVGLLQERVEAVEAATAEADETRRADKADETQRVADEDDRLDDIDSELSFLRLQLRGIEVQCRSHIPKDADPELTESIANWKADWAALRGCVDDERRVHEQASPKTQNTHDHNDRNTFTFDRSNSTF
ncbi:hypothetical protein F503_02597 [Ophiostoma piceae UAMH 11346]|uniref:Uncharacterized protein n=1 Tax=Ophiostoma piceae (strain UAMH 11346) TaxID=1262450 RepID=S3BYW5_OPHP1|nr:hypothetical protein F503_02597 [Ophiostoma piceae UAMH 11346]